MDDQYDTVDGDESTSTTSASAPDQSGDGSGDMSLTSNTSALPDNQPAEGDMSLTSITSANAFDASGDSIDSLSFQEISAGNCTSSNENPGFVPYFEKIENLGLKEEGTIYRVADKLFYPNEPFTIFNQYDEDDLPLEDSVRYSCFENLVPRYIGSDNWIVRRIYVHHREPKIKGHRLLKFHVSWPHMASQGRAHCFYRAHSNRYVAIMLGDFKRTLYKKSRDNNDNLIALNQKWHHACLSLTIPPVHILQSTGTTYDVEPRWMLCDAVTDRFSHQYVTPDNFNNQPVEYQLWTDIIQGFLHYVFDHSDRKTVISNLECDGHGKLSNVVCLTRNSPPYHSRLVPEMAEIVNRTVVRFPEDHVCNELCEVVGNLRMH
ncbi:hypothetical protein DFH28DRAFT_911500 [Melampsora americana]|nr:hypothetical protein DFH28DRAFT_911500 [Melampsora americana]